MESSGSVLQYITGWVQLAGLVIVVLGGLVPRFARAGMAQKNQRMVVVGLVALGALVVVGGIALEFERSASTIVTGTAVTGDNNAVGVGNSINSAEEQEPSRGEVADTRVTGDGNAVGVGNRVESPPDSESR